MIQSFIGEYKSKDTSFCDSVIDWFNSVPDSKKYAGVVGYNRRVDTDRKDSIELTSAYMPQDIRDGYEQNLFYALDLYKQEYKYCDINMRSWHVQEVYNIQYYKPGGGFKHWHCENSGFGSAINRHLVFMTYLNNVENGGTEFYYQNVRVKAEKGKTLIWPAAWTHTHKGVISEAEEKYIITGWIIFNENVK